MTVSDEIIKVLNAFSKKIGLTIDWTQNNILPHMQKLCDKYITYEIETSIAWIILGICVLILGIYCINKRAYYYKKGQKVKEENSEYEYNVSRTGFILGCVAIASILAGGIFIWENILNIITCVTFPEKMVLKELQTMYQSLK